MTIRDDSAASGNTIDGRLLHKMLLNGFASLSKNKAYLDSVNVFPVSDNDTGANMTATFERGISSLKDEASFNDVMSGFVKALLFGSKGNSGLILSQYFRGIHETTKGKDAVTVAELCGALRYANQFARKAVLHPVEGTVLTVMRDGIERTMPKVGETTSVAEFFDELVGQMLFCTQETVKQMDRLRDNNVVDSGALGLYVIFDGMGRAVHGDPHLFDCGEDDSLPIRVLDGFKNISFFRYCTECAVIVHDARNKEYYAGLVEQRGDSVVIALNGDILKVHIHTNAPQAIMDAVSGVGDVVSTKVDDLFLTNEFDRLNQRKHDGYAVVAFTSGEGNAAALEALGADVAFTVPRGHSPSEEELKVLISGFLKKDLIVFARDAEMQERLRRIKWFSNLRSLYVCDAWGLVRSFFALSSVLFADDAAGTIESLENFKRQMVFQVGVEATDSSNSVRYSSTDGKRPATAGDLPSLLNRVAGPERLAPYSTVVVFGGTDCTQDDAGAIRAHFEANAGIEFTYLDGGQADSVFVIGAL